MVERAANYLLSFDGLDRVVGPQQTCQFLDCYPEYLKCKQKPLVVERKNAHSLKDMEEYFKIFYKLVKQFRLVPEDIWNIDETRFRIRCNKAQQVIINNASKVLIMPDPDNPEYITSTKSINKVGHAIPAFLILQGKYMLHKQALYNDLLDETSFATSDSRYLNDELAMDWLKHFNKYSRKYQVEFYYLLIMDGYSLL